MTPYERRAVSQPKPVDFSVKLPEVPKDVSVVVWHLGGSFADALESCPKGSRLVLEVPPGRRRR